MSKQIEAMKLALEALAMCIDCRPIGCETMTEAREIKITNALEALREALAEQPAQQDIPDLIAGALGVSRGTAYDMMREALAEQQEPVAKVYRHGKASNGEPWHGVHWFDEGVNMPDGTLLYTAHGITKGNT